MNNLDTDEDVTATLTPYLETSREGERTESTPRQVMSARDDYESGEERETAAFATPYHEREFLSPGDLVQSRSPTETGSFHTADSLDSDPDRDTEVDEDEEREQIDTMTLIAGREKKPLPPTTARSPVSSQLPPQPQLFDLPTGYEDQPKLATRDEGVEPLREKEPIPMDSRSYRTPYNSNQPPRIDPARRATPQENTPLLPSQSAAHNVRIRQQSSEQAATCCCAIV